jgi:DNA polymerase III sliding clamp (beta) subunit (PCNA family)
LAIFKFNCPVEEVMSVPHEWLLQFRKVFTTDNVEICMLNNALHFRQGSVYGSIRLYDKAYPNLENVIPRGGSTEARVGKQDLLSALRSAKIVTTSDYNVVNMKMSNNEIKVSIANTTGQMEDVVPCVVNTEFESSYNLDFLIDAVKKLDGDEVVFTLRQENSPLVIQEGDYVQVIMPVRK